MNLKNLFTKKNSVAKYKKLPKGLSDEIANIKTCTGAYTLAKRLLNPDEILKHTGSNIKIFKKLEYDSQVSACIESRNAGVTSLNWRLSYEDDKHKDFYEALMKKLDVTGIVTSILKTPLYGYQPIEIVWGLEDGYIIPVDVTAKPQEWFNFSPEGELLYLEKGHFDGVAIPEDSKKFLVPRNSAEYLNPYGKSVLSRCFWDVIFKRGSKELWMKFAERFGMPTVIGKYPDGMNEDEINKLLDTLENLIQDAVGAIPDNNTIEFLDASSRQSSASIYKELIETADKSIAKSILGQTLTTDSGDSGSYALGNVHQQVRQDIIDSDARLCETQFNILLKWIHEFNFVDGVAPEFEFYSEINADKTVAERDKILSETGVKFTKKYYIKTYGLDEDDFELSDTVSTETEKTTEFSEQTKREQNKSDIKQQEMLDELMNNLSEDDLEKIIEPRLKAIIQTFSETRDIEEIEEALNQLYPEDDNKTSEDILAKALFISGLLGNSSKES